MVRLVLTAFVAAGCCLGAGQAAAKSAVKVKTTFYPISADSGVGLIRAMDKKGPRHGFMTRAIAQTSYTVGWEFGWARTGSACRLVSANSRLDMTYSYPKANAKALSPALKRRWNTFSAGVRKHEEMHGRIAREMVAAAERAVKNLSARNDPTCKRAQAEAKKRIGKIYMRYEARQAEFDKREHSDGGNVEKLLLALAGQK